MTANLSNNPFLTTYGQGLFGTSTYGLVQGTAYPDPASRYQLRTGWLANTETIPIWGGVAVTELIPGVAGGPRFALGPQITRATTVTGGNNPINGFSVFDQAYAMVTNPTSPVPLAGSYGQVMSYRLGSGARLAVACDAGLIGIDGKTITSQVAWDFVNSQLIPYTGAITVSSGTYNSGSGLVTLALASSAGLSPGDSVVVSGATGTGSFAAINGTFTAGVGTTGTTVTYTIATGLTLTITGGSLTTGAALPVSVLEVQASNCMTVAYNAGLNTASWNFNGSCAVIQL